MVVQKMRCIIQVCIFWVLFIGASKAFSPAEFLLDAPLVQGNSQKQSASFQISYNFSLPFVKTFQPDGLRYPVKVSVDGDNGRMRMDVYDGVDTLLHVDGYDYVIGPRIDKLHCMKQHTGPIMSNAGQRIIPDLGAGWEYQGEESVNQQDCLKYTKVITVQGQKEQYDYYINGESNAPVRLYSFGQDYWSHAHFDIYIADFYDYQEGPVDADVFEIPHICDDVPQLSDEQEEGAESPEQMDGHYEGSIFKSKRHQFMAMMPIESAAHPPMSDQSYTSYLASLNADKESHMLGSPRTPHQQHMRASLYHSNLAVINHINQQNLGYQVGVNRFIDWHDDEYEAIALGHDPAGDAVSTQANYPDYAIPYTPTTDPKDIPPQFDARGTLKEVPLKDQAVCGSCWAFAATGAMESAYYHSTGEQINLSEQQLVDCSWEYINHGCNGGSARRGIDYIVTAGGAVQEKDYEYLGQDGFCQHMEEKDGDSGVDKVKFKGFTYVPFEDRTAFLEAIYSQGPIAVSIDARQPGFRFYKSGVYNDPDCCDPSKVYCQNHAVLAVGYGQVAEGGAGGVGSMADQYFVVQNSWSKYWGDGGFIKMNLVNDCGASQYALYAVVDDKE